ncbi:MAG TPA: deoxyhypusine synthase family protein, partial [Bryobacteraceae bacterium]|nr:deoxyhypusine synthase family protein [Bryobacteraceae bacterium]
VQIVTAPITDGSLSSCPPGEAVTWGKVDKDTYQEATESMQADYSTLMPFIVKALLENRARYESRAAEIGIEKLAEEEPQARGYLRSRDGYRLFEKRGGLTARLNEDVKANREWLLETLSYPLAR